MKAEGDVVKKDTGRIVGHISYIDDYHRLLSRLECGACCDDPERAIKRWNDYVFGGTAEALWNKRLGLY